MADNSQENLPSISQVGKYLIIVTAFLGWFFAGLHLGITPLAMGSAAKDLLKGTGQFEVSAVDRAGAEKQIEIS